MATYSQLRNIDPDDEAQLLDTIDRWVEREVKPIAKDYDHASELGLADHSSLLKIMRRHGLRRQ